MNAEGSAVRSAVIADPEAVSVQRASARRHQPSVMTTASAPSLGARREIFRASTPDSAIRPAA